MDLLKVPRKCLPLLVCFAIAMFPAVARAAEPTLIPLPEGTHASALTTGPDGEIWFLGTHRPGVRESVGSYRADGTLSEFPLPGRRFAGGPVVGLGPDLWFGEERGNLLPRIGRMSIGGEFTEYSLGDRTGRVSGIAALAGSLWFGVARLGDAGWHGSIERLDPASGTVTTTLRLAPDCKTGAVAAEGEVVLFAEICRRKVRPGDVRHRVSIDRFDPSTGKVNRLLLRHGVPLSLVIGGDGSVWFGAAANGFGSRTAGSEPTIGRISPTGKLSEYPAPGAANLGSAALGPEGRLWFPSSVRGHGERIRGLNSIGPHGDLGESFCIAVDCDLEPYGLLTRSDGTIWFGGGKTQLIPPSGSSGIAQEIYTAAEAGFIGHFTP